jgi:hypothetical protein
MKVQHTKRSGEGLLPPTCASASASATCALSGYCPCLGDTATASPVAPPSPPPPHTHTHPDLLLSLIQKMFIVPADNLSLVLASESDTLYVIKNGTFFCDGWCQPILKKLIYGVGYPSIADTTNHYSGWGKKSLVSYDLASRYQR